MRILSSLVITVAILVPSLATAQCNGQFPAGTICGNPSGAGAPPDWGTYADFGLPLLSAANNWAAPQSFISPLGVIGSGSGTVSIAASTGTFNFNLPTTAGSAGQFLTSAGGGASAMTWTTGVNGPGIATDTAIVRFDGTSGKLIKNSTATISDGGTLTVNPTAFSTGKGIFVHHAAASGTLGGPGSYNQFLIDSDNVDAGTNFVDGVAVVHGMGGAATKGGRQALQVVGSLNAATNAANGNRFYVGAAIGMQAQASDGGGAGTEKGRLFALNPYVLLTAAGTHFEEASISEFNTRLQAGSSTLDKYGIKIVQVADDAVAGTQQDAALFFGSQNGAVGWGTLIQIGDAVFQNPLKTTGSVLATKGTPTFAHGIDFGSATCSTDCFKSPGFLVDGSGNVTSPQFKTTTALVTATNGGSTASFTANMVGSTGGPTTAAQNGWLKMLDSSGATVWVPVWK